MILDYGESSGGVHAISSIQACCLTSNTYSVYCNYHQPTWPADDELLSGLSRYFDK